MGPTPAAARQSAPGVLEEAAPEVVERRRVRGEAHVQRHRGERTRRAREDRTRRPCTDRPGPRAGRRALLCLALFLVRLWISPGDVNDRQSRDLPLTLPTPGWPPEAGPTRITSRRRRTRRAGPSLCLAGPRVRPGAPATNSRARQSVSNRAWISKVRRSNPNSSTRRMSPSAAASRLPAADLPRGARTLGDGGAGDLLRVRGPRGALDP
jgi:hypothetical protein